MKKKGVIIGVIIAVIVIIAVSIIGSYKFRRIDQHGIFRYTGSTSKTYGSCTEPC